MNFYFILKSIFITYIGNITKIMIYIYIYIKIYTHIFNNTYRQLKSLFLLFYMKIKIACTCKNI